MAPKFTPGPWMVEPHADDFDGPISVVSEYSMTQGRKTANWIAECDLQDDRVEENYANARLIAAAPDLYAAIAESLEYLDAMLGPCKAGCDCLLHGFHAAIAKAEGDANGA